MKFQITKPQNYTFLLVCLGSIFFIPFLGNVHLFDWDEINFAESAREMLITGNYSQVQINFEPFWEKPPLFFWLQAFSMHIFGVNEFAARFPNAIIGILTMLSLYFIGKKITSPEFGFLWALAHFGSFLPHLYFKSGIIDPLFNLLILWGCVLLFTPIKLRSEHTNNKAKPNIDLSTNNLISQYSRLNTHDYTTASIAGIAFGLAILTKGPVAVLIGALVFLVFWVMNRFKAFVPIKSLLITILFGILTASLWFGYEIWKHGFWFLEQFINYQIRLFSTPDAGHAQPFYYHFVVILFGCFPSSVFALQYFRNPKSEIPHISQHTSRTPPTHHSSLMSVLFWVVMILFSITTTKIVHYSSMAYFSVSYFAACFLYEKQVWKKSLSWGLIVIGGLFSFVLTVLPLVGMNAQKIAPFIKDTFAVANLQANANWSGYEWLIGAGYFLIIRFIIRKKSQKPKAKTLITHHSSLFFATATCLFLYSIFVVPKIEKYTQSAAIEFYESKAGQDVYVEPLGFKSYAHLFYFKKNAQKPIPLDSLLNGKIDKPVFFVSKIDRPETYKNQPQLEQIQEKNGFVFLRRRNYVKR